VLLVLAVVCWLVGGLSVLVGLKARLGAALLILCLVPATMLLHNFWAVGSTEMGNEIEHFAKNLGLAGGLLLVIAFGAGGFSIDLFLRMRKGARLQK
jgi:putative oxidoreductase